MFVALVLPLTRSFPSSPLLFLFLPSISFSLSFHLCFSLCVPLSPSLAVPPQIRQLQAELSLQHENHENSLKELERQKNAQITAAEQALQQIAREKKNGDVLHAQEAEKMRREMEESRRRVDTRSHVSIRADEEVRSKDHIMQVLIEEAKIKEQQFDVERNVFLEQIETLKTHITEQEAKVCSFTSQKASFYSA
jgi:hypothetical protein